MALLSFFAACTRTSGLREGALYIVNDGEGAFRVAKVLVVDDRGVHVRLYKNKWKERPKAVDLSTLSMGSIHDPDGFGMGHLPLSKKSFAGWQPIFLQDGVVAKDELDGYEMWKQGGGGYF